jgi:hypothetical protein
MSAEERAEVPDVPTRPEEIAELAVELIEDEGVAGRVYVWWTGQEPKAIPLDDLPGD